MKKKKLNKINNIFIILFYFVPMMIFLIGCSNVFFISNAYELVGLKIDSASWGYTAKGGITVRFRSEPTQSEIDNMVKEIGISMYIYNRGNTQYYIQIERGLKGIYSKYYTLDKARISIPNNWRKSDLPGYQNYYSADWEFKGICPDVRYYDWERDMIIDSPDIYYLYAVASNKYELSKLVKERWQFNIKINISDEFFGSPFYQEADDIPKHLFVSDPYKLRRN